MGRVSASLRNYGPHSFAGKSVEVPLHYAVVLHFDSCTRDKWETKFHHLMDSAMDNIPFPYYKASINALRRHYHNPTRDSEEELDNLYRTTTGLGPYQTVLPLDPYSHLLTRIKGIYEGTPP